MTSFCSRSELKRLTARTVTGKAWKRSRKVL
jgi:hypothetical protein